MCVRLQCPADIPPGYGAIARPLVGFRIRQVVADRNVETRLRELHRDASRFHSVFPVSVRATIR